MSYVECKHIKINITLICLMIELFWNENESSMSNILCFTVIIIKSTDHAINERETYSCSLTYYYIISFIRSCMLWYLHTLWYWLTLVTLCVPAPECISWSQSFMTWRQWTGESKERTLLKNVNNHDHSRHFQDISEYSQFQLA